MNNSEQKQSCEVTVTGVKGAACIWDCETGETRPITSVDRENGSQLKLSFKQLEAYWLVFDAALPAHEVPEPVRLDKEVEAAGSWKITFDARLQPVMEFPSAPPAEFVRGMDKPLEDWKGWTSKKFSGLMEYTKTIRMEKVGIPVQLDLGKVCHAAEVWVNGKSVGARLWGPYVFDVSDALRSGENEIRVRVANLINNSYGDTEESGLFGPVILKMAVETE